MKLSVRHTLLPLIAAIVTAFLATARAADPKPPSKREAREIEKALTLRFKADEYFAKTQRDYFDESSIIGQPIAAVIRQKGPATRVADDGAGGKIFAYESDVSGQSGEYVPGYTITDQFGNVVERGEGRDTRSSYHYVAYRDFHVNPEGQTTRLVTGVRGLPPPTGLEKMAKIWSGKISFPGKSRAEIAALIHTHIKTRGYVLKHDSGDSISYRHFTQFGTAQECGADLYGKVRVIVNLHNGELDADVYVANFSTIFGAKIIINANDDVASENNVPFNILSWIAPKEARQAFPEAMFDTKKKPLNPIVISTVYRFHEGYSKELQALAND
ncbi:hypothetical protein CMV30_07935 [Nibricoccus aquaticus]|uniref:Uncharacterized protein n=1 Tax=Nibricoccus aquaticus TaxID=2576891 RepID=A0A290Q618_9BACT|nr:hypothetical protein [Nibricoccus aquaticus]ATC63883.1 hypothetical protein CMV30_07935 [Nibricoccus aquaticus]